MVNKRYILLGFLCVAVILGSFLGGYYTSGKKLPGGTTPLNTSAPVRADVTVPDRSPQAPEQEEAAAPDRSTQTQATMDEWDRVSPTINDLIARHDLDKAIGLLDEFAARHPEAWLPKVKLAACYITKNDLAKAEKHLKEVESIAPDNVYLNQVYVNLYMIRNDFENAREHASKALKMSEKDIEKSYGYYTLARIYARMSDFENAKANLDEALRLSPGDKRLLRFAETLEKDPGAKASGEQGNQTGANNGDAARPVDAGDREKGQASSK